MENPYPTCIVILIDHAKRAAYCDYWAQAWSARRPKARVFAIRDRQRPLRPPNVLSFSCGEAPRACGQSGRLLAATNEQVRRAASASGMTPCVSGGKRGFSPGRGKRPATSCDEKLGGAHL